MQVIVSQNPIEVAHQVHLRLKLLSFQSLYVPAGSTPIPLYQIWEKEKPQYLEGKKLVPVDDVVSGPKAGLFRKFYELHLPSYLSQMQSIDQFYQADVAILGLGLNGHVAFHEPGVDPGFQYGPVELERSTCDELQIEFPAHGISYGVGSFLKCKSVIMIVTGTKKTKILNKTLLGDDESLPASLLKAHPDLWLFADTASCFG